MQASAAVRQTFINLALVVNFNFLFSIGRLYRAAGMYVIAVNNEMRNEKIITRLNNYCDLKVDNNIIQINSGLKNIKLAY